MHVCFSSWWVSTGARSLRECREVFFCVLGLAGRCPSGNISCSQSRGEQTQFLAAVPPWSGPRSGCRGSKATTEVGSLLGDSPWPTEMPGLGRSSWVTMFWPGCRQGWLPQAWWQMGPAPCSTSWLCLASQLSPCSRSGEGSPCSPSICRPISAAGRNGGSVQSSPASVCPFMGQGLQGSLDALKLVVCLSN